MRIGIFGGSFNPPHAGHVRAAEQTAAQLSLDKLIVVPAGETPHKQHLPDGPTAQQHKTLCELAFGHIPGAEISELELNTEEASYTADTLDALRAQYPDDEFFLMMGEDMLLRFPQWYRADDILKECTLTVFCRNDQNDGNVQQTVSDLLEKHAARIVSVPFAPIDVSSTELRQALVNREKPAALSDAVYSEIIRLRCYGARPEFAWLREKSYACLKPKRIPHVQGTEEEAIRLAERWGVDREDAAEAAILHDITKKFETNEQLLLCEEYGIINDTAETGNGKLLHAKTGAEYARKHFGVTDRIYEAIRWHTTGKAEMTLLEQIIYMADYIEPHRDFDGVDKLRELAYRDLDEAMVLGLEMSLEDLQQRGIEPHINSREALAWFRAKTKNK